MKTFIKLATLFAFSMVQPLFAEGNCLNSGLTNAFYTGPYKGPDDSLEVADFQRDLYCADKFLQQHPDKFLAVFGSSRIVSDNASKYPDQAPSVSMANDALYAQAYRFAKRWSQKHGDKYPILTGAGPGLMEATARGAMDGGGHSIGYTTYYAKAARTANPEFAYWTYEDGSGQRKDMISDGLIFTSVSVRETAMIMHSAAAVILPGGGGTNWETFQMLEMIKSNQLTPIQVYFLGERSHWEKYETYINDMINRTTIKQKDQPLFVNFVSSNDELLAKLETALNL